MSVCVTRGAEWEARCRVAHGLVPGLCDGGCPFVPDDVQLVERGGDRGPGGGRQEDAKSTPPPRSFEVFARGGVTRGAA